VKKDLEIEIPEDDEYQGKEHEEGYNDDQSDV